MSEQKNYGSTQNEDNVWTEPKWTKPKKSNKTLIIAGIISAIAVIIAVIVVVILINNDKNNNNDKNSNNGSKENNEDKVYSSFAVAMDSWECASIGSDIMSKGGNVVDGALASLFCNGVVNAQSMGLGGGFIMTIYNETTNKVTILNARGTAPRNVSYNMFENGESKEIGAKSAAVPGELMGYWQAKHQFGAKNVTWKQIIEPTVKLCENGITVNRHQASRLQMEKQWIMLDPGLRSVFVDNSTNDVLKEGDIYTRPVLAKTLRRIASNGAWEFYRGPTAQKLVHDIRNAGGIITKDDLANYKAIYGTPMKLERNNYTLYSPKPVSGGPVLAGILNILDNFEFGEDDNVFYQRLIESFKFAYGLGGRVGDPIGNARIAKSVQKAIDDSISMQWGYERFRKINDSHTSNDPNYYDTYGPDKDHGTANVNVVDAQGNAVAVTSTVYQFFGSRFMSPSTGVILNDLMADFDWPTPDSRFNANNLVAPNKRPMTTSVPSIITKRGEDNKERLQVAIGASGGSKIISGIAQTLVRLLALNQSEIEAVARPRVYHQLDPMVLEYETGLEQSIVDFLMDAGHQVSEIDPLSSPSVVSLITRDGDNRLRAVADFRKDRKGTAGE